jgi:predicted transcriptional regulator
MTKKIISARLPEITIERLQEISRAEDRTVSWLIYYAVSRLIRDYQTMGIITGAKKDPQ